MKRLLPIIVAAAFIAPFVSATAAAQPSTGYSATTPDRHRIAFELDFFHEGNISTAAISPAVYARFRLIDARDGLAVETGEGGLVIYLDVDWRGAALVGEAGSFRMGNPYVGASVGIESRSLTVRGSIGLTLPLTNLYDEGFDDVFAYGYALALHGAWDAHLVLPQTLSVPITGEIQFRTPILLLGADGGLIPLFSVPKSGDAGDPVVAIQLGAFAAFTPIPELAAGLRFQVVGFFGNGGEEGFVALVPFVRGEVGRGFIEGRFYMNLDDPYGFSFDDGKIWSVSVDAGAEF
ncbi:MAG: hypothetical protein JRH11_19425 [Deltaproteobacteria bacterium]|nr:hypothetical protein [Deltaproteobacteria bacterium]